MAIVPTSVHSTLSLVRFLLSHLNFPTDCPQQLGFFHLKKYVFPPIPWMFFGRSIYCFSISHVGLSLTVCTDLRVDRVNRYRYRSGTRL
ncbi:uncharacterized protein BO66DRAFT_175612 [Aspergillus aculeatinus CBS 121060]|uniref:Uncharacterized protein n=1 Tax=Aspergillus aculeatinus CBS 121060 TaxID=1448322 RepID=A0ACD1HJW5_9EURO|nr:hypothetical protein BO66DRAFT_175612 [Aspergillus aculeatinus CBS 121060]RAH73904.1 hypothetical protein BO66DRAFT_175612 [Aspergillus aculeatinus CBS 121060]